MKVDAKKLVVYIPDTRGVTVSPFGFGNLKIGPNVYTYSRLPGLDKSNSLGSEPGRPTPLGTCPGASPECMAICYAVRPVKERGVVYDMWVKNSLTEDVPESFPPGCTLVRLHVSGDFTSVTYINNWIRLCKANPHVRVWAYTRSWRIPYLRQALERLRELDNVQLFASMDSSIPELPPAGWRRAWIDGDERAGKPWGIQAHEDQQTIESRNPRTFDGVPSFICPEETKHKPNCEECGYCFLGERNDVTFLRH